MGGGREGDGGRERERDERGERVGGEISGNPAQPSRGYPTQSPRFRAFPDVGGVAPRAFMYTPWHGGILQYTSRQPEENNQTRGIITQSTSERDHSEITKAIWRGVPVYPYYCPEQPPTTPTPPPPPNHLYPGLPVRPIPQSSYHHSNMQRVA